MAAYGPVERMAWESTVSRNIIWLQRAEKRLATALRKTPPEIDGPPPLDQAAISERLAQAFPQADVLVVLDHYVGFKHRRGEHIVQVELRESGVARKLVVKLADPKRLAREHAAWKKCGIDGTTPVFMELRGCPEGAAGDQLVAIAYQDANEHIGIDETIRLEDAVRRSVRFGSPSLPSIVVVLRDLYAQLDRLHQRSALAPFAAAGIETMPTGKRSGERHRIADTVVGWSAGDPLTIRQQANAAFAIGSSAFCDPIDALKFWDAELRANRMPDALPAALIRGLGHGDLHAQNSIVGIDDREDARFPTLFDYERIEDDNLVGWDFVEMEIELKVRLFDAIFPSANIAALVREVHRFEDDLNDLTRHCVERLDWSRESAEANAPRARLLAVLLAIREKAFRALGKQRGDSRDWFREYLLLLCCYGATTVRYENQTPHQRAAAFASAGTAAARLEGMRLAAPAQPSSAGEIEALVAADHVSYQIPLRHVRRWNRSDDLAEQKKARDALTELARKYPAALHVRFERAFSLRLEGNDKVAEELDRIHADFGGNLDQDTWALWGRCCKDRGDLHLAAGLAASSRSSFRDADDDYREAIDKYEKARAADGGFFSAINIATLTFLRAGLARAAGRVEESILLRKEAVALASALSAAAPGWREFYPDDAIWTRATEAEAAMLQAKFAEAGDFYRSSFSQRNREDFHLRSIGRQLRRILDGFQLLSEPVPLDRLGDIALLAPCLQPEIKP
jgi:tetratricopeptide repeat protein/uncharacterized protein associated with vWA-MoxR-VMAP ternary system